MTHQTVSTDHAASSSHSAGSAMLPIIGGGILTLLWGAYTVYYVSGMMVLGPL
jgi:hypothetical protein